MGHVPFIDRVRIHNYKSIADCDVRLGPLTLLVGRNGSGKSNFLDALRFVNDALQFSLDQAVLSRIGIKAICHRGTPYPHDFGIAITLHLSNSRTADYEFKLCGKEHGGFAVKCEQLRIFRDSGELDASFRVDDGIVLSPVNATTARASFPLIDSTDAPTNGSSIVMPPASLDRLYLVNAAGLVEFREVYDALLAMRIYHLDPTQMKRVQIQDAGELLRSDGSNIASVVARMAERCPQRKERITDYLRLIFSDVTGFVRVGIDDQWWLEFRQKVHGSDQPWHFGAASMSDGTLRALGILVATMQLVDGKHPIRLVGIEEPETALHPAAAGALMDALHEAAANTQILITTHSPDLVDELDLDRDTLLVVQSDQGSTEIGPADAVSLGAIRDHLYSPGELLRKDLLQPDHNAARQTTTACAPGGEPP
jgi:predicted ATPase